MKRFWLIAIALVAGVAALPAHSAPRSKPAKAAAAKPAARTGLEIPKEFNARCVGVADGDTVQVLLALGAARLEIKVRLYGIDAPERGQAFAGESHQSLAEQASGKVVKVYSKGLDEQGRLAAWVFVGGQCLNARQIEAGLAWWDRARAPGEKKLEALRKAALEARRGLWSEIAPTAPWEWRQEMEPAAPVATPRAGSPLPEMAALPPAAQRAIVPEGDLLDLPDMTITRVEFQPSEPKAGEMIQPILHYKNIGSAPADAVLMSYAKNGIDGGGDNRTGPVAPGQELSWLMGGLRATKAGEYPLKFALDPENKIKERNEANNTLTVVLKVRE